MDANYLQALIAQELDHFARDLSRLTGNLNDHRDRHRRIHKMIGTLARIEAWSDLLQAEGR